MENGQRPGNNANAEKLQQALRAFGAGAPPNPAELAELAQRMGVSLPAMGGGTPRAEAPAGPQYVIVGLDTVEMAWPAPHVAGVERVGEITLVPNTVSWVMGVANLRGTITSVVDLRRFFGMVPLGMTARSRIVVASVRGMVIGFLVDGVNAIQNIPLEAQTQEGIRQSSPPWLFPYVTAQAQSAGRWIFVVDIERLLFADGIHHYRAD